VNRVDRTTLLGVALLAAGLAGITIAWIGVSATLIVPTQVAFAVSGGIGGVALAGAGVALLLVQGRRYAAATERRDLARFSTELADVAELLATRRARPARRRRRVLTAR
jgi:hypothetical protein